MPKRKPLRDDAVIVRFGLMELPHVRDAVEKCFVVRKYYGLSFFGENDLSVEEIAREAGAPQNWLRVTSYGALRTAGYRLRRQGARNHLTLRLNDKPSDEELKALIRLFDEPEENPHPLK